MGLHQHPLFHQGFGAGCQSALRPARQLLRLQHPRRLHCQCTRWASYQHDVSLSQWASAACDSWSLCVCVCVFLGVLESDYPASEEVPQDTDASQGDRESLAGSVASMGSTGSDGTAAAEGTTAIPQTATSGPTDQASEHSAISGSGQEKVVLHQPLKTTSSVKTELLSCIFLYVSKNQSKHFQLSTVELSRETSPTEDGVPTAEEATEATEANAGVEDGEEEQGADQNQPGIYTEHVFTDPLGVGPTDSSPQR